MHVGRIDLPEWQDLWLARSSEIINCLAVLAGQA